MPRLPRSLGAKSTSVLALALLGLLPTASVAVSGVCPDGSIFIVQDARDIPCRDAKTVEPGDIPPVNPEFLPRPYGWEVFQRESDPNNPYNLVDLARPDAGPGAKPLPPAPSTPPQPSPAPGTLPAPSPVAPPPQVAAAPPPRASAPALQLSPTEIENLVAIVDVLQDRAPATLLQRDADAAGMKLRFARSTTFEARLAQSLAPSGRAPAGPVVVFHASAPPDRPGAFWGNLTFVQGHVAFTPDKQDPAQFGVVDGALGALPAGGRIVGYAALPQHADPGEPLDVYWNDRRITAVLSPY